MAQRTHDSVSDKYGIDLLDPRTWYRGVFGEGTRLTDVGYGGDSGMSPPPDDSRSTAESEPNYTGLGPKGYHRSDERISDDIHVALGRHPELDATNIEVKLKNGAVTLEGRVEDRTQKHLAEDLVESIRGVRCVENHLMVKRHRWDPFPGYHWV